MSLEGRNLSGAISSKEKQFGVTGGTLTTLVCTSTYGCGALALLHVMIVGTWEEEEEIVWASWTT